MNKEKIFAIRVTDMLLKKIIKAADKKGLKKSEWARAVLEKEAEK